MKISKGSIAIISFLIVIASTIAGTFASYGFLKGQVKANEDKIETNYKIMDAQYRIILDKLDKMSELQLTNYNKLSDSQSDMREDLSYIKAQVNMIIKEIK